MRSPIAEMVIEREGKPLGGMKEPDGDEGGGDEDPENKAMEMETMNDFMSSVKMGDKAGALDALKSLIYSCM